MKGLKSHSGHSCGTWHTDKTRRRPFDDLHLVRTRVFLLTTTEVWRPAKYSLDAFKHYVERKKKSLFLLSNRLCREISPHSFRFLAIQVNPSYTFTLLGPWSLSPHLKCPVFHQAFFSVSRVTASQTPARPFRPAVFGPHLFGPRPVEGWTGREKLDFLSKMKAWSSVYLMGTALVVVVGSCAVVRSPMFSCNHCLELQFWKLHWLFPSLCKCIISEIPAEHESLSLMAQYLYFYKCKWLVDNVFSFLVRFALLSCDAPSHVPKLPLLLLVISSGGEQCWDWEIGGEGRTARQSWSNQSSRPAHFLPLKDLWKAGCCRKSSSLLAFPYGWKTPLRSVFTML